MKGVLQVDQLSVFYHNLQAVHNISFEASVGKLIGIIGPNGAGKSSIIKGILGLEKSKSNCISAFGEKINKVRKKIAYVPQRNAIDWDFPVLVEDVVMMGRFVHIPWYKRPNASDKQKVKDALKKVGMEDFSKRQIGELSGGQQQRVFIARALAQEAELFFLDEPFVGIDVTSEDIIIKLLRDLRTDGKTIFVVHHDLNKVEDYFDQIMLVNKQLVSFGNVREAFNPELLSKTYGNNIKIFNDNNEMLVVGS